MPNGVSDEIKVSGGKAEKVQRTDKKVLQASDIVSLDKSPTNVDYIFITKPIDYKYYNSISSEGIMPLT